MELRLGGTDADTQQVGDLAMRATGKVPQRQHVAGPERQPVESRIDVEAPTGLDRRRFRFGNLIEPERLAGAMALSDLGQHPVSRQMEEPAAKRAFAPERVELSPSEQERLLGDVVRPSRSQEAARQAVDASDMGSVERLERSGVSGHGGFNLGQLVFTTISLHLSVLRSILRPAGRPPPGEHPRPLPSALDGGVRDFRVGPFERYEPEWRPGRADVAHLLATQEAYDGLLHLRVREHLLVAGVVDHQVG